MHDGKSITYHQEIMRHIGEVAGVVKRYHGERVVIRNRTLTYLELTPVEKECPIGQSTSSNDDKQAVCVGRCKELQSTAIKPGVPKGVPVRAWCEWVERILL